MRQCRRSFAIGFLGAAIIGGWGCRSKDFRLPPDGNAQRGKADFVALGCHNCHEVVGTDLPRPAERRMVAVTLGGVRYKQLTEGCLVTAIIYPPAGGESKKYVPTGAAKNMPCMIDNITVRELTDIVAFLQASYKAHEVPAPCVPPKTYYWSFRMGLRK